MLFFFSIYFRLHNHSQNNQDKPLEQIDIIIIPVAIDTRKYVKNSNKT